MWVLLAVSSALCLGFYDVFKKLSVRDNDVLMVLLLNTVFGALYMSPVVLSGIWSGNWGLGNSVAGHGMILIKSMIVLGSWILVGGYLAWVCVAVFHLAAGGARGVLAAQFAVDMDGSGRHGAGRGERALRQVSAGAVSAA